jgi:hypothetical protein
MNVSPRELSVTVTLLPVYVSSSFALPFRL